MYLLQYERGMYAWQRQAVLLRRLREASGAAGSPPLSAVAALGRAALAVTALRARSAATVRRLSAGESPGPEISVDKALLSTAEQAVFDAWRQLVPSAISVCDEEAAQLLREEWFYSRASPIFGGAVDIQKDIVADRVLALPRGIR
jgi:alkylation response protein AidB-like acyl-CoA dehydrogenase